MNKLIVRAAPLALALALAAAACGSTASTRGTSTSTTGPSTSTTGPATSTTRPLRTYLSVNGSGGRTSSSVTLPVTWQLKWQWLCNGHKETFAVTAVGGDAGSGKALFEQTGVGGGGQKVYPVSGRVHFTVATDPICTWKLSVIG